jgi:hypothetical protein
LAHIGTTQTGTSTKPERTIWLVGLTTPAASNLSAFAIFRVRYRA